MWYRFVKKAVTELEKPLITRHKTQGLYGAPAFDITAEKDLTSSLGAGSKAFGPGHYTSLNPHVTGGYAGRYTRLEVLPAGARIIDSTNIPKDHVIRILKKLQEMKLINLGNDDDYLLVEASKDDFKNLDYIKHLIKYDQKYALNSVLLSLGYDAIQYPSYTNWIVPRMGNESDEEYNIRSEKIKASGDNILVLNRALLSAPRLFEKSRLNPEDLSYEEVDKLQNEMYLSTVDVLKVLPKEKQLNLLSQNMFIKNFTDEDLLQIYTVEELSQLMVSQYNYVKYRIASLLGISIGEAYKNILNNDSTSLDHNLNLIPEFRELSNASFMALNSLNGMDIPNEVSLKLISKFIGGNYFLQHGNNVTFSNDDYVVVNENPEQEEIEKWLKSDNLKNNQGEYLSEAEKHGVFEIGLAKAKSFSRMADINNIFPVNSGLSKINESVESLADVLAKYIYEEIVYWDQYCFSCGTANAILDKGDACSECGFNGHGYVCKECGELKEEEGDCEHCGYPDYKCSECGAEDNWDSCEVCGRNKECPSCGADYYVESDGCNSCGGPYKCSECNEYKESEDEVCDSCGADPNGDEI